MGRMYEEKRYRRNPLDRYADIRGFRVATVFLGIDHNVAGIGSPQWFETTVSRSSVDDNSLPVKIEGETFRYPTLADALAGHVVICEKVKSSREIGE